MGYQEVTLRDLHPAPLHSSQETFQNGPQRSRARPNFAKRTLDREDHFEKVEKEEKRREFDTLIWPTLIF